MKQVALILLSFVILITNPNVLKGETNMISAGKTVKFHYTLTVKGEVAATSDGNDPLEYVHGQQMIIPGLERQLEGLKVGDERESAVSPEDAYGLIQPEMFLEVPKSRLAPDAFPPSGWFCRCPSNQAERFQA